MRNLKIRLTKYYIGLDLNLTKSSDGVKLDIQYPCAEFYSICKGSTSFTEGVNFIQIKTLNCMNFLMMFTKMVKNVLKKWEEKKKVIKEDGQKRVRNESPASLASVNGSS